MTSAATLTSRRLSVVGDGSKRDGFEQLAQRLFLTRHSKFSRTFVGTLQVAATLGRCPVLPSDCGNEAFGIVQLGLWRLVGPRWHLTTSFWNGLGGTTSLCRGHSRQKALQRS